MLDKELLASLGETVLPAMLGVDGQRAAIAAFATWCNEYEPVAEEMHGYGYADVRYLPADPVPAEGRGRSPIGRRARPVTRRSVARSRPRRSGRRPRARHGPSRLRNTTLSSPSR